MKKVLLLVAFMALMSFGIANAAPASLSEAIYEQPALITSVGQSADAQMVNVLFNRLKLNFKTSANAKPEELNGVKTLVLVIGGSSKGLGAAGIDADQEAERVQQLIDKAKADGIKIMAMHVGGESRRGSLTDRYIPMSTADADYAIIVKSGDADGMFAKVMDGKFMDYADKIGDVTPLIQKAFK